MQIFFIFHFRIPSMETLLPSGTKRKRHTIPLQIKNAIIEDSATESNSNLAKKYCVGESTIRGILKDKAKILKAIEMGSGAKRANLRGAKFAELEETLLKWVIYAKKQGVIIKGGILKVSSVILLFLSLEGQKCLSYFMILWLEKRTLGVLGWEAHLSKSLGSSDPARILLEF